jgi:hypothetical protein
VVYFGIAWVLATMVGGCQSATQTPSVPVPVPTPTPTPDPHANYKQQFASLAAQYSVIGITQVQFAPYYTGPSLTDKFILVDECAHPPQIDDRRLTLPWTT